MITINAYFLDSAAYGTTTKENFLRPHFSASPATKALTLRPLRHLRPSQLPLTLRPSQLTLRPSQLSEALPAL